MIQGLLRVLEDLHDKNMVLLGLFREERQCLIDNNMERLQGITLKEMEFGLQISEVEKLRQKLVKDIKQHYMITSEVVTIKEISAIAGDTYGDHLLRIGRDLKETLKEIMDVRILNNTLIQKMLGFNERNIKLFMNIGNKNLTYDGQGHIKHSRKQILDSVV
ncbi:MAG: flagellar protein FlgN [Candidatus Omnitrophica bacterium]|nr:flagellar protein FlgN [Candidatus Omnitrophota bacterium]